MSGILLVDDDPDQVELRQMILEGEGHGVRTAANADEAFETWSEGGLGIVVMDLRLPHPEDGLGLIRRLRATGKPVHIIVTSGWIADLVQSDEAQLVDHILQKPVRSEHLLQLLRRAAEA